MAPIHPMPIATPNGAGPDKSFANMGDSTIIEDAKLNEALQIFYTAFNDRDIEQLLALFEPQAVYITSSGHHARNQTEIRAAIQGILDQGTKIIQGTRETIVAGDIALMISNWKQAQSPTGTTAASGTSNIVFRRQPNGNWLIAIDNPIGIGLLDRG